jgi:hypothetical protein
MEGMSAMTIEDAQAILTDRNVITVGARGDEERRRRHGVKTTFSRVLEVHHEVVPASIPAGASAGEIRLAGTPASIDAATEAAQRARAMAGDVPVTGFSLSDLLALAGGRLDALTDMAKRLAAAGLQIVSEVPLDKISAPADAIRAVRDGGLQVLRLTVSESDDSSRLRLVSLARDVQDAVGGIRAFAPLARVSSIAQPSTGYDDVRHIAVARLFVHNIDSIQVDWQLYLGRRRSPLEEIKGNITAAGLEAVERDGQFSPRKTR